MPTNERPSKNDSGCTDTQTRFTNPPAEEITSTFTTDVPDDAYTGHIEPVAAGTHEWDHRRTTYVYAEQGGDLLIQARYYHHGTLEHVYEHTVALDGESALAHARESYDINPSGSLGDEFEMMVGCSRPWHLRLRDLRDRLHTRLQSALAATLGGA